MVRVSGSLVRCEEGNVGTIVSATEVKLSHDDWKNAGHADEIYAAIRSGFVATVRWQKEMNRKTTHVFYEGIDTSACDFTHDYVNLSLVK